MEADMIIEAKRPRGIESPARRRAASNSSFRTVLHANIMLLGLILAVLSLVSIVYSHYHHLSEDNLRASLILGGVGFSLVLISQPLSSLLDMVFSR
jgi:hypothetical protein